MEKQKIGKEQRQKIVLVALYLFSKHGREKEVSRSELIDCIKEFQKDFPLGYEFSEKNPYYCHELFDDLSDMWFQRGYIKQYKYGRRDIPLFPKNFIALWSLGRGQAKIVIKTISPEIIEALHKAIEVAVKNYQTTWGAYAR